MGITADGALVYVGGPGLNITDLADILARAGAVRAMELDINTDWVDFASYQPHSASGLADARERDQPAAGHGGGPARYFAAWWSRDFITMSARPPAQAAPSRDAWNSGPSPVPRGWAGPGSPGGMAVIRQGHHRPAGPAEAPCGTGLAGPGLAALNRWACTRTRSFPARSTWRCAAVSSRARAPGPRPGWTARCWRSGSGRA